ncbi:bis-aminopropyl spermidine synthase family protein [Cryptosporangium aurantiacum]|uniref:bis-aminopropyl spermidine synthase family protein n=1 Tax=Cryptosporangium aurantiacum TaxID=134849 RepID=UPI000934E91C|nr:bis-aminopropyl spermidine synthase family protein [Cryptosporangium aurantiacum]
MTADSDAGLAAVAALVAEYGVHSRPIRDVVVALTDRGWTLAELVRVTAVPRRTVEEVLAALGPDLAPGEALRIRGDRAGEYRERFGLPRTTALADPLGPALAAAGDLLATMTRLRADAPPPRRALDHVAATPETAVRRALWLDAHFDLAGGHLLCVGDHDLTALATCLLRPELTATVVDVDERLLAYLDGAAVSAGLSVRCLAGDLRFGLPPAAAGRAGLAFTDPPYTPDGVRLFLERAVEGLTAGGQVLLAYGFSERTPALGLAVQRTFGELELVVEAQWPAFSRYDGAQAVGSASDLYLLRPTNKARRKGARGGRPTIYTHGEQSAEASGVASAEVAVALVEAAAGPEGLPVLEAAPTPGVLRAALTRGGSAARLVGERPLGAVWTGGIPGPARSGAVAVDATADPGSWLLRILLAVDARRVAVAVGNQHPDLADAVSQRALAELVAPKWALRFRRSTPGPTSALVEAVAVDEPPDQGDRLVRHVLDRAHGKLVNVWRDGLVTICGLPKPDATRRVAEFLPTARPPGRPGAPAAAPEIDATLMEIPRHRLTPLFAAIRASV